MCPWQIAAIGVEDKELCSLCIVARFTCHVNIQVTSAGETENSEVSPEVTFQTHETLLEKKMFISESKWVQKPM